MCMSFDLVIKNGRIIDGAGNPWYNADVYVRDGRIAEISRAYAGEAERVIDAKGLIVCPGFLDMHNHSEYGLLVNPRAESFIRQGVTTLSIGHCGFSPAPVSDRYKQEFMKLTVSPEGLGLDVDWHTYGEYFAKVEGNGTALNIRALVGHGTVRTAVMGVEDRDPNPDELDEMKTLIDQAFTDGVVGVSTGLTYVPACYSKTEEIVELCKVAAKYGGIHATHIRSGGDEGVDRKAGVQEAIEISEKTGVPVEIAHYTPAPPPRQEGYGPVEEARGRGVDVTFDAYPYDAGGTALSALLPSWVMDGGYAKMIDRIRRRDVRERIKKEQSPLLRQYGGDWSHFLITQLKSEEHEKYEGKTIEEIADAMGADPWDAVCDLLIKSNGIGSLVLLHLRYIEGVYNAYRHPAMMVGSDGRVAASYGVLNKRGHPRWYGTYPRVLGRYVREMKLITLQDAIRRMTSFPAQRMLIRDRGVLREGMWADIAVFNPETVIDMATYISPQLYPVGIEYVIVNGQVTIEEGEHTGALAGRVLRYKR